MTSIITLWSRASLGSCKSTLAFTASAALAIAAAPAAERTYTHYRFQPTDMSGATASTQLSEFEFSLGGTPLNLQAPSNEVSQQDTGEVVNVTITSGEQDPAAGEGPDKVADGDVTTKWFKGDPTAEPLDFEFTAPVTIDAYNWASANDSVLFGRSPISWRLYGSDDPEVDGWTLIDVRLDYPITNENETYQDGFPLPDVVDPVINTFAVAEGTPAIALNGTALPFEWETVNADSVTISPGPGAVDPAGSQDITPPADATTTYELEAAQSGGGSSVSESVTVRSVTGGSSTYQYVRFTATRLGNGTAEGLIQISEFSFYDQGTLLTGVTATNPGGDSPAAEEITNLVDGVEGGGNKWLSFVNTPVVFDFGAAVSFDSYSFFTGNDAPERDPIQWRIEGANELDGENNPTNWELIENVDFDYPTPAARGVSTGVIPLPGSSLPPTIQSFVGDALTLVEGEPLVLSYEVGAADTVTIDQGVGEVSASGSTVVTPGLGETTYTLTATRADSPTTDTASYTVEVISQPAVTGIDYDDFSSSGEELELIGDENPPVVVDGRLRLTPDLDFQYGFAWFRTRQALSAGFEATFGYDPNQEEPSETVVAADGLAFVVQNSAAGSGATNFGDAESGLPENALNIRFDSFTYTATSMTFSVLAGSEVLTESSIYETPGVRLEGMPASAFTIAQTAGGEPHEIRVVYVPGDLDVYFNGIALAQNLDVDLGEIGAVDASGEGYVGFMARTGGNAQNADVTSWRMRYGDFTETLPFGMVTSGPRFDPETGAYLSYDVVWNAREGEDYSVDFSNSFEDWTSVDTFTGIDGQIGYTVVGIGEPKEFYRVEELEP